MWLAYVVLFILLSPGVIFTVPMGKKMGGRLGVVAAHAVIFLLVANLLNVREGFQWTVNATPAQKQGYKAPVSVKPIGPGGISPAAQQQQTQQQVNQAKNQLNSVKTQYQNALNTLTSDIDIAKNALNQMASQLEEKSQMGIRLAQNIDSPTPAAIQADVTVAQTSSDPLITATKSLISTETKLGNDSKNLANLRQKYNTALQTLKTAEANLAKIPGVKPPPTGAETGGSGLFGDLVDMSSRLNLVNPVGPGGIMSCGPAQYKYNTGDGNTVCAPCTSTNPTGNAAVDSENTNSMLSSCI